MYKYTPRQETEMDIKMSKVCDILSADFIDVDNIEKYPQGLICVNAVRSVSLTDEMLDKLKELGLTVVGNNWAKRAIYFMEDKS